MLNDNHILRCILVTHPDHHDVSPIITCLQHNGVTSVQFRKKNMSYQKALLLAKSLHNILKQHNAPMIINDDVTLALALQAEGVHLGQTDGCVKTARQTLGSNCIIGLTVHHEQHLAIANTLPINYIGIGPVFNSMHKHDATIGCALLTKMVTLSKHPVVAIGGICAANVSAVLKTGVHGIAAIDAFYHHPKDMLHAIYS
jgi:thiamine-phosphate pyrophosphorylase